MNATLVNLREPTEVGRLFEFTDPETVEDLIFFRNTKWEEMVYNININGGLLILGANANRILTSIEVGIPYNRWKIDSRIAPPVVKFAADIEVVGLNVHHVEMDLPVEITCNQTYSMVYISLSEETGVDNWVSLSDGCFISTREGKMCSLFFCLKVTK